MNGETKYTSETTNSVLEHHRGTLILVLGILSLVGCTFFTGIPAWIMGKGDLTKMKEDQMDSDGKAFTKAECFAG